jgi:hypothetical protein
MQSLSNGTHTLQVARIPSGTSRRQLQALDDLPIGSKVAFVAIARLLYALSITLCAHSLSPLTPQLFRLWG